MSMLWMLPLAARADDGAELLHAGILVGPALLVVALLAVAMVILPLLVARAPHEAGDRHPTEPAVTAPPVDQAAWSGGTRRPW